MMSEAETGCRISRNEEGAIRAVFDSAVYRLTAVKKAAYKFSDEFYVYITPTDKHCEVILKPISPSKDTQRVEGELCNEALDQELRELVATETEGIRNLLMAQAFSPVSLVDECFETNDYEEDTAGISSSDSQRQ